MAASGAVEGQTKRVEAERLLATAKAEGTAAHVYSRARALLGGPHATRNLADAIHHLCILHGRFPGVIDLAAEKADGALRDWLAAAAELFAAERAWLTKLVVAAGPLPSTPHQAAAETAVAGQRHALEMLARSDRSGCAIGAALALLADWRDIRLILDTAADRFGLAAEPYSLPDEAAIAEAAAAVAIAPGPQRAMQFGAQQLLVQHRGLWDLLEARAEARHDA